MTATPSRSNKRYTLIFALGIGTLSGIVSITGCHKAPDAALAANDSGSDPADANMAPVDGTQQQAAAPVQRTASARVLPVRQQNESQQQAEEYPQTGTQAEAPGYAQQPQPADQGTYQGTDQGTDQGTYDPNYENQVDAGQQALEADTPPPPLPTYQQPEAPAPNYIWTPGYWNYAPVGYYWVPGAWVLAPYPGALWTPGYWGVYGNRYRFYRGFWGPHIGFYGGINYGFGYTGSGYHGGYWNGNNFYYNRAVNRINETRITNVYNRTVVVNNYNSTRVSYNGGRGGVPVRPQPAEIAAMRGPRTPPMSAQIQNQRQAAENRQQFYSQNKGRPAIVASPHPFGADRDVRPVVRPVDLPRPNQPNNPQVQQNHPVQPQIQPGRPQVQPMHPAQPQVQAVHPAQPAIRPGEPQIRPVNPTPQQQPHPAEHQPGVRPAPQSQSQIRPVPESQPRAVPENQVKPTPQVQPRPVQPAPQQMERSQPAERPAPQAQPRPVQPPPHQMERSQPAERPAPQVQPRPVQPPPQQMQRSQPAEKPAPHASEFRSQSQPHPAPQSKPQQAPHGEEHRH